MNLRFTPVHTGLGFHPFENGLPYTPAQSKLPVKNPVTVSGPIPRYAPKFEVKTETKAEEKVVLAPVSFFSKWAAAFLDTLLLGGVSSFVLLIVLFSQGISLSSLTNRSSLLFVCLYFSFFHFSVLTAQEILTRTSLGKALFGLELEGDALQILFRSASVKRS